MLRGVNEILAMTRDLGNGDAIHIDNFNRNDVFNSSSISSFEFDDGTTLTSTELLARGFDIIAKPSSPGYAWTFGTNANDRIYGLDTQADELYGNDGDDTLYGGAYGDTLEGGRGKDFLDGGANNDMLKGNDGNDTLDGGTGNDTLNGGGGSDIYLFGIGSGRDYIVNYDANATADKVDAVQFAPDITSRDVTVQRSGTNGLTLSINGTTDTLTIADYFYLDGTNASFRLEEIRLADTVWTVDQVIAMTTTGTNVAPVTTVDVAAVQEDLAVTATGNVLANDSDVNQGTILTVANAGTRVGNFGSLTLNADGSYNYALDNASLAVQSLAAGQVVTETFAYQATDSLIAI